MKTIIAIVALVFAAGLASARAESASELLARSDADRTIPDMSFEVQVISYDGPQTTDRSILWGNLKLGSDHNRVLLSFRRPASKYGQKFLVDGDAVYVLFEHSSNPIRVSPLEVLTGQASDGDVVRTFASDYDIASMSEDTLDGKPALHFALRARKGTDTSSYKTVQLWIDPRNLRLRYAEFYAASGVLLKKAYYKDYKTILGKDFPTTIDIWSGDDARKHTTMVFMKVGRQVLPDTQFRRTALAFWNPEEPR